jgi:hypothetical protein
MDAAVAQKANAAVALRAAEWLKTIPPQSSYAYLSAFIHLYRGARCTI